MNKLCLFILCVTITAKDVAGQFTNTALPTISTVNLVPKSPQAEQLVRINEVPVNLSRGVPEISFTLYTATVGKLKIPISIHYDASGIRYDDIPSAVGLKWTLNAGGEISRSINGRADELDYFANSHNYSVAYFGSTFYNTDAGQAFLKDVASNINDISHDQYSYNYLDRSGYFYCRDSVFRDCKNPYTIKIAPQSTFSLNNLNIIDDAGNRAWFGNGNTEVTFPDYSSSTGYDSPNIPSEGTTAWKLYKLSAYSNEAATFEYDTVSYSTSKITAQSYTLKTAPNTGSASAYNCNCGTSSFNQITANTRYVTQLVKNIHTPAEDISFYYATDNSLSIYKRRLDSIVIKDKVNQERIKVFHLHYDTYTTANLLRLKDVYTFSAGGPDSLLVAAFHYNASSLAGISSLSRDIYGYYNGAGNSYLISTDNTNCPSMYRGGNRTIDSVAVATGMLDTVYYPTGGKTTYHYSSNRSSGGMYGPGARVDSILYINTDNSVAERTYYTYNDPQFGYTFSGGSGDVVNNINYDTYNSTCPVTTFHSEAIQSVPTPVFYYTEVAVKKAGASSGSSELYKEIYTSSMDGYGIHRPFVSDRVYFRANNTSDTLKIEHYSYADQAIDSLAAAWIKPIDPYLPTQTYTIGSNTYDNTLVCAMVYPGVSNNGNIEPRNNLLVTHGVTLFDQSNASLAVKDSTTSTYNGYWQKLDDSKINSKGLVDSARYTYLYTDAGSMADSAKKYNVLAAVNKMQRFVNGTQQEQSRVSFGYHNGLVVPDSFFIKRVQPVDINDKTVTLYDSSGQPEELFERGGYYTSYIRDFNRQLLVAYAKNAKRADIAYTSFEGNAHGGWTGVNSSYINTSSSSPTGKKYYTFTGTTLQKSSLTSGTIYVVSYWSSTGNYYTVSGTALSAKKGETINGWTYCEHEVTGATSVSVSGTGNIDELRLYPKGALMSSYTYLPLIGISSESDPTGKIGYYQYDSLNRLQNIRDQYGNILKTIDYKYKQ